MRIANVAGQVKLVEGKLMRDVSGFSLADVYDRWDDFVEWAGGKDAAAAPSEPFDETRAGPPSPHPRQVFAVALNYSEHAAETGVKAPDDPLFFTKFVSAFSGAHSTVTVPESGNVDWETELVAVIGREARNVEGANGWDHVAGLTVGNDISERNLQRSGPAPQFSLAKSHIGFSPQGPTLVTPDELENRDDLALGCDLNGESMQSSRTSHMIFSVPELVAYLSGILTLYPGDVIFTGTPPGVGAGRNPQVFIKPGDTLHTWIEGVGEMVQKFC